MVPPGGVAPSVPFLAEYVMSSKLSVSLAKTSLTISCFVYEAIHYEFFLRGKPYVSDSQLQKINSPEKILWGRTEKSLKELRKRSVRQTRFLKYLQSRKITHVPLGEISNKPASNTDERQSNTTLL